MSLFKISFSGEKNKNKQTKKLLNRRASLLQFLMWSTKNTNSHDHFIYYCGQESPRRNGAALIVNKRVWNAVLGWNLKNNRMISVHFKGKPLIITVMQVYAPTSNAEEVEQFYEDLQDLRELTPIKDVLFSIGDWNAKVRSQDTWSNRQIWP